MEGIRDAVLEMKLHCQQHKRESLLNKNRNIENIEGVSKPAREEVLRLATAVKKQITCQLLSELKSLFLQGQENVEKFLEVDGALEALVKALSGKNSKLQMNAAYCICNLSLGIKYLRILKIAGPYLLLHLEGMNTYLVEVCAWTLGNLSSHHKKCVKHLKSQGALPILIHLLSHNDQNISIAAAYALTHFVYSGYDVLDSCDFQEMIGPVITFFKVRQSSVAYLMSMLSANVNCQLKLLQESVHIDSFNFLVAALKENILHCSWYIRIIGNLITETTGQAALVLLDYEVEGPDQEVITIFRAFEYIVRSGQIFLIKECCWLLGNLLNHPNVQVPNIVNASGILEKISNSVRYLLIEKDIRI